MLHTCSSVEEGAVERLCQDHTAVSGPWDIWLILAQCLPSSCPLTPCKCLAWLIRQSQVCARSYIGPEHSGLEGSHPIIRLSLAQVGQDLALVHPEWELGAEDLGAGSPRSVPFRPTSSGQGD